MRFDLHNHTRESNEPPDHWFPRFMGTSECYIRPVDSHDQITRVRGLDGLAITNHNTADDALGMQDRHPETVIAGCEYTVTAGEGYTLHVVVLDIDGSLHERLARIRHQGLERFTSAARESGRPFFLAHVAWDYLCTRKLTPPVVEDWLRHFDIIETKNSTRMLENTFAVKLARYYGKAGVGGSDGHNLDQLGRAWTESASARTKEAFLADLREGRVEAGGEHGSVYRFEVTIRDLIRNFYRRELDRVRLSDSLRSYLSEAEVSDLARHAIELFILPHLLWLPRASSIRHMREMQMTALSLEREFVDYLVAGETRRVLEMGLSRDEFRAELERSLGRVHRAFGPAGEDEIDLANLHLAARTGSWRQG